MKFINNIKPITILLLMLLGIHSCGQEVESKIDTIINRMGFIENIKSTLIEFQLDLLKYRATGEDSIKLEKIENLLTDEEIRRRITLGFYDVFTDTEIDVLYNFIQSSVFDKVFSSAIFIESASNQFKDITIELDKISTNIEEKSGIIRNHVSDKFEPIPVERVDGFYATVNYNQDRDKKDIILEELPSLTKEDIQEVEKKNGRINITLKKEGANKFHKLTHDNIGKPIAIVIDKHIVYLPMVNSAISGGKLNISGDFSDEELENLINELTSK